MIDQSPPLVLLVAVTFCVAGVVKGVTGMGLPTVAMGVLGALISPLAAASLLIIPSFVTNLWQLLAGPGLGRVVRRFWTMMLAIVLGTQAGTALLTSGDTRLSTGSLGAVLVLYAALALSGRHLPVPTRLEPWLSPLVGGVTGLVAGATGVFVVPAVPYLQALKLEKDELVQALGLSFTISTVALAVIPALGGMWVGQFIRGKVSAQAFRRWFLICLLLLGLEMLSRPLL